MRACARPGSARARRIQVGVALGDPARQLGQVDRPSACPAVTRLPSATVSASSVPPALARTIAVWGATSGPENSTTAGICAMAGCTTSRLMNSSGTSGLPFLPSFTYLARGRLRDGERQHAAEPRTARRTGDHDSGDAPRPATSSSFAPSIRSSKPLCRRRAEFRRPPVPPYPLRRSAAARRPTAAQGDGRSAGGDRRQAPSGADGARGSRASGRARRPPAACRTGSPGRGRSCRRFISAAWLAFSTPSATVVMPSVCATRIVASISTRWYSTVSAWMTNERSILTVSTGSWREAGQRRVAGAEVVERQPHAERLQLAQRRSARVRPAPPGSR